jgi:hypothetical protein
MRPADLLREELQNPQPLMINTTSTLTYPSTAI